MFIGSKTWLHKLSQNLVIGMQVAKARSVAVLMLARSVCLIRAEHEEGTPPSQPMHTTPLEHDSDDSEDMWVRLTFWREAREK